MAIVTTTTRLQNSGYTLIEILMTMAISMMLMSGVFMTLSGQRRSYFSSDQVAQMQQNYRAAMVILTSEIREAGCNPTRKAQAGIVHASKSRFHFTRDICGHVMDKKNRADGSTDDANESIVFGFSPDDDKDSDGIADKGVARLGRNTGAGFQPIAENIQAVEFNYILKNGNSVLNPSVFQLPDIRSVQISLLARSKTRDPAILNTSSYTTGSGRQWGPFNDYFRRRFFLSNIQCRNLGFNQ